MAASTQIALFPDIASDHLDTVVSILTYAAALGAREVAGLSDQERQLLRRATRAEPDVVRKLRKSIRHGEDPLGDAFTRQRSPVERRPLGATYTPQGIVSAMVQWSGTHAVPARVIDPGVGSARFLAAAGGAFPKAQLLGFEIEPLAALIARANLKTLGLGARSRIALCDYRAAKLPDVEGRTLYIGNPPYVRHHLIATDWKNWLVEQAKSRGFSASQLAGLHVHFFLATVLHAKKGDYGALLTASEWLDVNYGQLVRELFLGPLGGQAIAVVEPTARPFPDAATTAAITTFEVGSAAPTIRLARAEDAKDIASSLIGGTPIRRERLAAEHRWTPLLRVARTVPSGYVELGELCRVHRGAVTGKNSVWIAGDPHTVNLPTSVLFPSVTKARELFNAGAALVDAAPLRRVIDLPVELDELSSEHRKVVAKFLRWARSMGAHKGYVATHRRAWWSVGLRAAPPIMATYMARRPPAFVQNPAAARYINIAHGIYPREPMTLEQLGALVGYLTLAAKTAHGRTYAGGLMKFEPREMERICVPRPELLGAGVGA